jgi:hypothetical protein
MKTVSIQQGISSSSSALFNWSQAVQGNQVTSATAQAAGDNSGGVEQPSQQVVMMYNPSNGETHTNVHVRAFAAIKRLSFLDLMIA